MKWTDEAFWRCSWAGFLDAWAGHCRFVLGSEPDDTPMSRAEATNLDHQLAHWQRTGRWEGQDHG